MLKDENKKSKYYHPVFYQIDIELALPNQTSGESLSNSATLVA
jgi:hypothetical protein